VDELDRKHRAEPTDVADRVPALLPGLHSAADGLADLPCPLDEALVFEHVQYGQGGCLCDGIADVGPADCRVTRRVHDLCLSDHARQRQTGGDRLRDRHQVGLDVVVLDAPHLPRAAIAGLHFVDDEHDAVVVADAAHAFEELRRRHDEAAFTLHGLDHDCRDGLGGDGGHERALERGERLRCARAAVVLRIGEPVDLGCERPESCLVGMCLGRQRQRQQRATVEASLEADN